MNAAPPANFGDGSQSKAQPRWLWRVVTILLVPPACVGAYYIGQLLAAKRHSQPQQFFASTETPAGMVKGLFIEPRSLELGELREGPDHVVKLTVENRGQQAIKLTDFATSCDCSSLEPRALVIAPGQSAEIRVTIDLMHRLPWQHGLERRPLSVRLNPVFDRVTAPVQGWEITATVRSFVSLETPRLQFDDKCVQYGPPATRKLRALAHVPVKTLNVCADGNRATCRAEPADGKPGEFAILVTPDPNLPVGPFRFDVKTIAIGLDGEQFACAPFTVHGEMQPPARIVPGVVLLGERLVGEAATAEFTIRLPDGAGWAVDHIEIDGPDTAITPTANSQDKLLRYTITQGITKVGDQARMVRFVVREPNGKTEPCPVKIIYHGESRPGEAH